jgi:hypothetical protein
MGLREVIGSAPLSRVTRSAYGPGYTFPTHVLHMSSRICACPTLRTCAFLSLPPVFSIMSTSNALSPVTRIACFKFNHNVTAEQKGGRTSAFLDLYAQHPELLLVPPKGGRPLSTPLDLTNVKREKEWDTGFIVVFKVYRLT